MTVQVQNIRIEIERQGLKQREIANYLGISEAGLNAKLNERRNFKLNEFLKLCVLLNKNPSDFLQ